MRKLAFLFILLGALLSGCTVEETIDSLSTGRQTCTLSTISGLSSEAFVCLDPADATNTTEYCSGTFKDYFSSISNVGTTYSALDSDDCNITTHVGSCVFDGGTAHYYSTQYNSTTANSHCISTLGGNYTANE